MSGIAAIVADEAAYTLDAVPSSARHLDIFAALRAISSKTLSSS